jgi:hypothetical protein
MRQTFKFLTAALSSLIILPLMAPAAAAETDPARARVEAVRTDMTPTLWGLTAVRAQQAWGITRGAGVTVAVLDTGVDGQHPDLIGRVLAGRSTAYKMDLDAGVSSDRQGHGTHVAGIIAGNDNGRGITGVAPDALILPVQVLGHDGSGSDRSVAEGIDWAVANGADVLNLSLGGGTNPFNNGASASCEAVGRAFDAGVVVVISSGNSGAGRNPRSEPASCRGSLSVAAADESMNRTFFSSYDASVGISGPGRRIVSAVPLSSIYGEYLPFEQWDGTSMAAPYVAGAAALVRAANPGWTAAQVVAALQDNAVDLGTPGFDSLTGAGLVDAYAALTGQRRTPAETRSAVGLVTVPRILDGEATAKGSTIFWEAPVGTTVSSYILSYRTTAGDVTTVEFPGTALSGLLPKIDAWFSGSVFVTAVTPQGERTSVPFLGTRYGFWGENFSDEPSATITTAAATWTKQGLRVTFKADGPESSVKVFVTASGLGVLALEDILSTQSSFMVPVADSHPARASYLSVWVSSNTSEKYLEVAPMKPMTAIVKRAGTKFVAVTGNTAAGCFSKARVGCTGAKVTLVDAKTKKVLGTTRVLDNLTYSITYKLPSSAPRQAYVTVAGKRSATVTLKADATSVQEGQSR